MSTLNLRRLLLASAALAAAGWGSCASAQATSSPSAERSSATALEEIVVTARRREENLQTTPVAITAVSAEMLQARNVFTLAKISQIAPNMNIFQTSGSVGSAATFIRGIGYADNLPGQDSPIGFYMDGVAIGRLAVTMMELVEPQRVEVLRGPQGTLFGRNTTGGAILVTTHAPSDEFGGSAKASYGTHNNVRFQGRIDTGLIGDSGVKATFAYSHHQVDGYEDVVGRPRDQDPGAQRDDSYFFKAAGEWDKLTATFAADYSVTTGDPANLQIVDANANFRNLLALSPTYGGGAFTVTGTPQYKLANAGNAGEQRVWNEGLALTLNYELSDHLSLKSISSVRAYKAQTSSSYGPGDFRVNLGSAAVPRIVSFNGEYSVNPRWQSARQRSQEFQLLGDTGDFNYVAGFYYFKEGNWETGITRLAAAISPTQGFESITPRVTTVDSKSIAGFGQVNYKPEFLDKKLELTGGVRWTKDTRDFVQYLVLPQRSANLRTKNWSYLASVNYQWTDDIMTYGKFSTGYRSGGFTSRAVAPANPIYQPEKIKSWEVGFKAEGFDHRARLNGSAFYNKYRNLQVAAFQPPGATSSGGNTTVNANAKYKGFELEAEAVPIDRLTLSASVGYVKREYVNYPRALEAGIGVPSGCTPINNAAGVAVGADCASIASFQYTPSTTAAVGASYTFPKMSYGELTIRSDYSYMGKMESGTFILPSTPFFNSVHQKAYGLLSARATLADIPLTGNSRGQISIYGENLTNKKYSLQGIDFGFFATKTFADRRTVGIEFKADF
jgi:iron complex outermembrane receptor protein